MGYVLGLTSNNRMEGLDPKLIRVVRRAIQITTQDFMVLPDGGLRTLRRQMELYAKGRTLAELRAVGIPADILARPGEAKVTWTLKSRHMNGKAVDIAPYPIDWDDSKKFDKVADAMFSAAKELSVKLRWGADWDMDGKRRERGEADSPHFEIN